MTIDLLPERSATVPRDLPRRRVSALRWRGILWLAIGWICVIAAVGFYAYRMVGLGIDVRNDFWTYFLPNHDRGDINAAFSHGASAYRTARSLAGPPTGPVTLAHSGPGLLDEPLNARNFLDRWHALRPLYAQLMRGWVAEYDNLLKAVPDGNYEMDYPPMRLFIMELWAWRVQTTFPGVNHISYEPIRIARLAQHRLAIADSSIVNPLLNLNTLCTGIAAVGMFFLVWLWTARDRRFLPRAARIHPASGLRLAGPYAIVRRILHPVHRPFARYLPFFGDPLLLAPAILLGAFLLLRPMVDFTFALPDEFRQSLIDQRVFRVGFWIVLVLRFSAAVALARFLPRPFRGPACGLVAATLVWLNPAAILDSHGWPQWDMWIMPFLILAALAASLDCWLIAGLLLGAGCMFKGQILFFAPVLLLAPAFAGWPGRLMRVIGGFAAGAGAIVSPWLLADPRAVHYIQVILCLAAVFCALSLFRGHAWSRTRGWASEGYFRWKTRYAASRRLTLAITVAAAFVILLIAYALVRRYFLHLDQVTWAMVLLAVGVVIVPWAMPRRHIFAWLVFVFAAAMWIGAFRYDANFSWYQVGFVYGTRAHEVMSLSGPSLCNLAGILGNIYHWDVHDIVTTLRLPGDTEPMPIDLRNFLAIIYGIAVMLCAIAGSIHLRRRDPRFLVSLTAPCLLFPVILTQMSVRYPSLPAVMAASFVAVSTGMSLLQLLLTVLSCTMFAIRLIGTAPAIAPGTYAMINSMFPDLGWAMLLAAAVLLFYALAIRPKPEDPLPLNP